MNNQDLKNQIFKNQTFTKIIFEKNKNKAEKQLINITKKYGLGISLLIMYYRDMEAGAILSDHNRENKIKDEKYHYIYNPVRAIRGNHQELKKLGILSDNNIDKPLIFHEDSLVVPSIFNLKKIKSIVPDKKSVELVLNLLSYLKGKNILEAVEINSKRIKFLDKGIKEKIAKELNKYKIPLYVPKTGVDLTNFELSNRYFSNSKSLEEYIKATIKYKNPCNFCNVSKLFLKETLINTDIGLNWQERYGFELNRFQGGMTFAPFISDLYHALFWSNGILKNMNIHPGSIADLIKLNIIINSDLRRYFGKICRDKRFISIHNFFGGCSLTHEHQQLMIDIGIPISKAKVKYILCEHGTGLQIQSLDWPTPVYRILKPKRNDTGFDNELLFNAAEKLGEYWLHLCKDDIIFSGIIDIINHTANCIVIQDDFNLNFYFIPRLRSKLDAIGRKFPINKFNLAALETSGVFIIDKQDDWEILSNLNSKDRTEWADDVLKQISPDPGKISEFEKQISGFR